MDKEITEKELQSKLSEYLKQWFYVQQEVWNNTHESRIDIVLIHKKYLDSKGIIKNILG